ncbi:MAG: cytochrome c [Thiobacillaceae bacterium]|jgi:cytochrome c2|nr:cytochrome c [Thiobacillaceae bacterium]
MKRTASVLALAALPLFAAPLAAQAAAPFHKGDAKVGEKLHKEQCAACHVGRFGGDGSKIYTRADRRVKSASALAQQITTCNSMLGNHLFPEDEQNLGAYLNKTYYKFK